MCGCGARCGPICSPISSGVSRDFGSCTDGSATITVDWPTNYSTGLGVTIPMSLVPAGVYGWSPGNGGVHHYRIAEPLRVASSMGVRTATGVELDNDIAL